jgi:hypothetical protein
VLNFLYTRAAVGNDLEHFNHSTGAILDIHSKSHYSTFCGETSVDYTSEGRRVDIATAKYCADLFAAKFWKGIGDYGSNSSGSTAFCDGFCCC